ncbi:MAG: hypothetical protein HS108_12560 [Planctomycetes bacterium]|nr:hypothetical protein [Planctomycetota bacterium]
MNTPAPAAVPTRATLTTWHMAQTVLLAVGTALVLLLLLRPTLGLYLLWDVLIPVAPLLLAVAPGIWRNICPLGTFSLLPRRLGLSRRAAPDAVWQGRLLAGAVVLLVLIVPLRHVILDHDGVVTGVVLLAVAALAAGLGAALDWKSAWCSGLCPVHPVELLYGTRPLLTVPNSQCDTCTRCTSPCRDARGGIDPVTATRGRAGRAAGWLLAGAFPGFVWGWFQVPPRDGGITGAYVATAYGWPLAAGMATLALFAVATLALPRAGRLLTRSWAAAAIGAYYWFKLPVLLGLEGTRGWVDGAAWLGPWALWAARLTPAVFFVWLMVIRRGTARQWASRPAPAAALTR